MGSEMCIRDSGCEYMTGGRVVILGSTGRNFAAGMSGGIAYIYDTNDQLLSNINLELVEIEAVEQEEDIEELKELISNHANLTGSVVAQKILDDWSGSLSSFKKVIPGLYRDILKKKRQAEASAT